MGNVVNRMRQLDAAGHPYDLSGYDAFGSRFYCVHSSNVQVTPPDAVGYGGQFGNVTDVEANLILMGFRFYSPQYCRFLTRDPAGYEDGLNLYAYCRNNPINYVDPLGLQGTIHATVPELPGYIHNAASAVDETLASNPLLVQQVAASSAVTGSALYSYVGGASTLGPVGVAVVAIPIASYVAYTQVGTPLANKLFEPQTLGSSVDPAYSSIFNRLRNCFVAGTLIAMANGTYKPIEEIREGDKVLSRDPLTGHTSAKSVLQTFTREVEQTLILRFDNGETVETTPGHPFYVEGKGFVLAGQLALGNAIVTRAGPAAIVTGIQNKSERVRVYNFEVEDFHTYFVGSHNSGLWVHNISLQALVSATQVLGPGGYTMAGIALSKHGNRGSNIFPALSGNTANKNQVALNVVEDILTNPQARFKTRQHKNFGKVLEVTLPDKRGLRYTSKGVFIGFIEGNY